MKVIHKFSLPVAEHAVLTLPVGAEVIRVDGIDGYFWLWAIVDTKNTTEQRRFNSYKTGGEIPKGIQQIYVGCASIYIQMELMLYWFMETSPMYAGELQ